MANVHLIYKGESHDFTFEELFNPQVRNTLGIAQDVFVDSSNVTENQLKQAVATYMDVNVSEFGDHKVELNPNGNATIRMDTPFGV